MKKIVTLVIFVLIIISMINQIVNKEYINLIPCLLVLVSFLILSKFKMIDSLKIIIILFIYSSIILGGVEEFYSKFPNFDILVHTVNGFLMATLGFSLIRKKTKLIYAYLFALTFSSTIGVLWEFMEFSLDRILSNDCQKDYFIDTISSVRLSSDTKPLEIKNVKTNIIGQVDGNNVIINLDGYLDIGITDTIKDLFVNYIGAIIYILISNKKLIIEV